MENLSIFKIIHEADHSLLQDRIIESRLSKNYDNGNNLLNICISIANINEYLIFLH